MIDNTPIPPAQDALPTITTDVAKAKIKLSLTTAELSMQAVQDKADALVYNEDNLTEISDTITAIKKLETKIDEAFEEGKKPYLEGGRAWDAAKRDLKGLTTPILTKVSAEHTKLCQAIEKRKRETAAEDKRKSDIGEKINTTILGFSQEITACKTTAELVSIQNRINAEQGKKSAYQEFLPTLVERCAELNQPLKDQKEAVKKLEDLEKETQTAIETGNDELLQEVENKKEEVVGQINENKVKVEESAINSSIRFGGGGYTQTYPTVKPKRVTVEWEITDMFLFNKRHPTLTQIVAKDKEVEAYVKTRKEEITDQNPEILIDGLRIFQQKKFS